MRSRFAPLDATVTLPGRAGAMAPALRPRFFRGATTTRPFPIPAADGRRPGQRVGPYRLLRLLGEGGMATVWLALWTDRGTERLVALKMPALKLESPLQLERFDRERDFLARLQHPGIARLLDAGLTPGSEPYIAMEYVSGPSIVQACDERGLSVAQRVEVFLQVLSAVDCMHRHGIVHRDIKPSNVLLNEQGCVKLLDFGIAKAFGGPSGLAPLSTLTQEAGIALTPQYAAPEQFAAAPVTPAADIYALGALLYELLTGRTPHAGGDHSVAAMLHAVLYRQALPPSRAALQAADAEIARCRCAADAQQLSLALAGPLDDIVLKAISKAPLDRHASARTFADALQQISGPQRHGAAPASWWQRARAALRARSRDKPAPPE